MVKELFRKPVVQLSATEMMAPWRSPTRRNRLPGRIRFNELRRNGRSRRALYRPAPTADERLIGILMLRDEEDILPYTLSTMTQWFDRIVALNGSSNPTSLERSQAILEATPEVVATFFDEELPIDHATTDGCRQFLLDEVRQRWGIGNWVGVLHADESWDQDPRPLVRSHNPRLDPVIRARLVHGFIGPDSPATASTGDPRTGVGHYMWPGVPESRLFYDAGDRDYEIARHTKVVPTSFRTGPLHNGFMIVGYNERTPAQLKARAADRSATGWQRTHYANVEANTGANVGVDTEADGIAVGSLHERSPSGTFDAAHHDPRYGRARAVTEAELPLQSRQRNVTPIFLGGVGRTGSRLTRDLLASSPSVQALPLEMKFVSWPAGALDLAHQPKPSARRLARWWARMLNFSVSPIPDEKGGPTSNWGFRANLASQTSSLGYTEALRYTTRLLAMPHLEITDRQRAVNEFIHWLFDRVCTEENTAWVEQTPANIDRVQQLLDTFPDAQVWNVVRDPRDVVASLVRAWWGPSDPEAAATLVADSWQRWSRFQQQSPDADRTGIIRFEELVTQPDQVCATVWERVGCAVSTTAITVPEPGNQPASRTDFDSGQRRRIEAILKPTLTGQEY